MKFSRIAIRIFLIMGFSYSLVYNRLADKVIHTTLPVKYKISKTECHSGGRGGDYYTLDVFYNEKKYELSITEGVYDNINENKLLPKLYYNKYFDSIIYEWQVKMSKRFCIVIFLFFTFSFLPFSKINAFLDKKIKERQIKEAKKVRSMLQMRQQSSKKEHDINTVVENKSTNGYNKKIRIGKNRRSPFSLFKRSGENKE